MYMAARKILVAAAFIGLCFVIGMGGLACCTSCGGWSPITTITVPGATPTPFHLAGNNIDREITTLTPGQRIIPDSKGMAEEAGLAQPDYRNHRVRR
jgi:hypothetical protein